MFSLTLNEVREWRDSLSSLSQKILTAKVRNDYLSDVKRLFSYCDLSTIEKLEFLPKGVPEKDFYTIEEVQKILDILRPHKEKAMHRCYATAVLCFFAGLRQSEALVLDWNVINKALRSSVEKKSFVVTDSKTGSRQVFMNETLIKWLEIIPSQERQGKIFKTTSTSEQGKQDAFSDSFRNAVKGIRVIKNGLRHSCATYLVAINNNYDAVARQMGHTVSMQKKHYMRAITYEEAMAYWNLTPFSEIEGIEFAAKEEIRKKEKEAVVALLDEEDEKKKDALIEHMQNGEDYEPFMDMLENPNNYDETMLPTTKGVSSGVSGKSNEQIAEEILEQSRISKQKEQEILKKIDTLGDGKTWIDEDDVMYSKSTILASKEERKEVRKIIKELEEGKFNPIHFDAESMKNERGRGEIFIRSSERSTDEN